MSIRLAGDPVPSCVCGCCKNRLGCLCLDYAEDERCDCDYCIEFHGEHDRVSTGIEIIAAERQRQIEQEGWTPEHDGQHEDDALAAAAACYATPSWARFGKQTPPGEPWVPLIWPWERQAWKPTPDDRIRELVKAGALIAAEIDRLTTRESVTE